MSFLVNSTIVGTIGWLAWRWKWGHKHGPTYVPFAKGDTLDAIAARFGTTSAAIIAANGPGFARFYAPDGTPVSFTLPQGLKDAGPSAGAQGQYLT